MKSLNCSNIYDMIFGLVDLNLPPYVDFLKCLRYSMGVKTFMCQLILSIVIFRLVDDVPRIYVGV